MIYVIIVFAACGTIVRSQFDQRPHYQAAGVMSDTRSDTSSPTLDTPVGSPLGMLSIFC